MPALIKFQRDWADEFDVYGFKVVDTMEEAEGYRQHFEKPRVAYFGTNEGWEEEHQGRGYPGGVLANSITITEINMMEAVVLKKLFGNSHGSPTEFGYLPIDWDEDDCEDEG